MRERESARECVSVCVQVRGERVCGEIEMRDTGFMMTVLTCSDDSYQVKKKKMCPQGFSLLLPFYTSFSFLEWGQ